MFGLETIGKILGSDKVIESGIKAIDSFVYTDEEKAVQKTELLKHFEPFKLAQRYLALLFSFAFVAAFIASIGLSLFGLPYAGIVKIVEAFNISWIVLSIVTFYFTGGTIESFKKNPTKA
jgi:hypothetical protein